MPYRKNIKNDRLHRWLAFLSADKEVLRLYHMREMAQIDYNSGIKKAKDEGKIEGKIEIARNLLKMNMPRDQIADK